LIGQTLSHFKITAKLGEGGMGEVYRAEDRKLGREVAIKVLPEAVANDPERLARFEREAKVLASLNHPNIAAIYSLESADVGEPLAGSREGASPSPTVGDGDAGAPLAGSSSINFLVMELVEGEDLMGRLDRGPISFAAVLPIALQMAEALEAAHEKGIIHRDLKPANVKVTPDGQVKVLDFGLAKALDPTADTDDGKSPAALSLSPTLTAQMTGAGIILGTAAYMSPEQAKGEAVDKRADIWAFGLVLFEMLTGRRLFATDSVAETLAGVIKTEIDFSALPSDLPTSMVHLLRRCLERDPKNRLHDIADARIVVDDILAGRVDEAPPPSALSAGTQSQWKRLLPYVLAAIGLFIGLLSLWSPWATYSRQQSSGLALQFAIQAPEETRLATGLALSPDGRKLAMVARGPDGQTALWVRDLDSVGAQRLSGTTDARYPFWAPSSREIGFFAQARLKVTDLIGSTPRTIADTDVATYGRGAAWGLDDTVVYGPSFTGPLMRVSAAGGEPEPATRIPPDSDIGTHRFPYFLGDGRHFVFYASVGLGTEPGTLFLGELGSLDVKPLGPASSMAVFAEPGFLLYVRGQTLVAERIDLQTQELVGEPEVLGVTLPGSISVSGHRSLAVSQGILASRMDTRSDTRLVLVDRAGRQLSDISADHKAWHNLPRLSPDGRQLVVGTVEPTSTTGAIWLHDLERGIANPFQHEEGHEQSAIWSPTGDRLAYATARAAEEHLVYLGSVDRPDEKQLVFQAADSIGVEFWAADGRAVVISKYGQDGRTDLWMLNLDSETEAVELFPGAGSRWSADLAPDGQWVVYSSDETRRPEVYARHIDGDGPVLRVSPSGGAQPVWGRDGREVFYVNPMGEIVAVPVSPGDPLEFGQGEVLFNARLEESLDRQYDVSPDGQRFVLNQRSTTGITPIVVTTDWQRLLPDTSTR